MTDCVLLSYTDFPHALLNQSEIQHGYCYRILQPRYSLISRGPWERGSEFFRSNMRSRALMMPSETKMSEQTKLSSVSNF